MSLKLYHAKASPFVRMVRVVLHEAGMADEVELVQSEGSAIDPGTMPTGRNPLGKIPTLERADGVALYDSRVICRYLDDLGACHLYPAKPRLWETLTLEATAHGICDAAILMVYEERIRPKAHRHPPWVEGQWAKVSRALDALEGRWMSHLAGPLDIGQIATGCALGYLDFRHGARDWRAGRPALAEWSDAFGKRPSLQATRPDAA